MTVGQTTLKLTNYTLSALLILSALVSLWMWVDAILWWGDAYAFASALTWTVVTLALFGFVGCVEWVQNRGE